MTGETKRISIILDLEKVEQLDKIVESSYKYSTRSALLEDLIDNFLLVQKKIDKTI